MLKTDAEMLCYHYKRTFDPVHPYWCLGLVGSQIVIRDEADFCNDIYYVNVGMLQILNNLRYYLYHTQVVMGPNHQHLQASSADQFIIFALTSR
jgi:hypothetical protein